jgi:hypothetical protein
VIDGGKALLRAIRDVFGEHALVHRCHRHKERNVADFCPSATARSSGDECAPPGRLPIPSSPASGSSCSRRARSQLAGCCRLTAGRAWTRPWLRTAVATVAGALSRAT